MSLHTRPIHRGSGPMMADRFADGRSPDLEDYVTAPSRITPVVALRQPFLPRHSGGTVRDFHPFPSSRMAWNQPNRVHGYLILRWR
jgi:hypothetical protein